MLFHFRKNNVTFFPDDQEYFETKIYGLKKFLGNEAGDEDTIEANISIEKNKHESGERFEAHATLTSAHHGKFHSEVVAENIKKCADLLHDKLKPQIEKFHAKHLNK